MPIDLNEAAPQREMGLIDDGTVCVVQMSVRPGNAGEGGWLKRSKEGGSCGLDAEFTVVDGVFAKRKFWNLFTLEGPTDGHQKAAEISVSRLRAIVESARGIRPDDTSDAAKAARRFAHWGELDGVRFLAKIGVEHAKADSGFKDKNVLEAAITPDRKAWVKVEQPVQAASAVGATFNAAKPAQSNVVKPKWAS